MPNRFVLFVEHLLDPNGDGFQMRAQAVEIVGRQSGEQSYFSLDDDGNS